MAGRSRRRGVSVSWLLAALGSCGLYWAVVFFGYKEEVKLYNCYQATRHQDNFNRFADFLEPIYENTLPNVEPNDSITRYLVTEASKAMEKEQSQVEWYASKCLNRPLNLDRYSGGE